MSLPGINGGKRHFRAYSVTELEATIMIRTRCKSVQGVWKGDKGGMPGDPWVWTDSWNRFLKANDFPTKAARLHQVKYSINYLIQKLVFKFFHPFKNHRIGIHVFLVIGGQNRGKREALGGGGVDQCTRQGLECILDDNDGEINHINSLDPAPRVWIEGNGNQGPRQWELKDIPRARLEHLFVQRG